MSEIIDLNTQKPIVQFKRSEFAFCESRCRDILIDEHKRIISCRECGRVWDPFDWIKQYGHIESSTMARLFSLQEAERAANERVENLKNEEQKIKARIRSAKNGLLNNILKEP